MRLVHQKVLVKGIAHRNDQTAAGNGKRELVSANMHLYNTLNFFLKNYKA